MITCNLACKMIINISKSLGANKNFNHYDTKKFTRSSTWPLVLRDDLDKIVDIGMTNISLVMK